MYNSYNSIVGDLSNYYSRPSDNPDYKHYSLSCIDILNSQIT